MRRTLSGRVEAALKKFDPARGGFAALAQTALANRVKNYWRDRKPVDPLERRGISRTRMHRPEALDEARTITNGSEASWQN